MTGVNETRAQTLMKESLTQLLSNVYTNSIVFNLNDQRKFGLTNFYIMQNDGRSTSHTLQ